MSFTNRLADLCSKCRALVEPGKGAIYQYVGAAKKHAPRFARRNATGGLFVCLCSECDAKRKR